MSRILTVQKIMFYLKTMCMQNFFLLIWLLRASVIN